jgi:Domain of unknown function (DUF4396)
VIPLWLHDLSIAYLLLGVGSAAIVSFDLRRRHQRMWIMNAVWPVTALFGTAWIVWQYFVFGGRAERPPFPVTVATGTLHCGAGCTLGDISAEWIVFAFPTIAVGLGWHSLFDDKIFSLWIADYLLAYAFGIVFQYFTIVPMRELSFGRGIAAAVKADTLSLTAWQLGMYGFVAVARFIIFPGVFAASLSTASTEFWFVMHIAMLFGFVTSYPVNWWLLRKGVKEPM